jgi:hypothetical protein
LNSGNFTGEGVPGSYTSCTKAIILPGTYTLLESTENTCDIQVDGVTINGGNNTLGRIPLAFPENGANGWIDMADNALLLHMDDVGAVNSVSGGPVGSPIGNVQADASAQLGSNAVDLDTSATYIVVQSDPSFAFGTGPFTVSFWAKLSDLGTFSVPLSFGGSNSDTGVISINSPGGAVVYYANGYHIVDPGPSLNVDQWYNFILTGDGGSSGNRNIRLYRDGTQVGSTYNYDYDFPQQDIFIGANQSDPYGEYTHGSIDEIAVWNTVLSDQEISDLYDDQSAGIQLVGNETGLVSLFHFNQSSYGVVDSSGNGNDMTAVGDVTFGAPGTVGTSIRMDGVSSYLIRNSPTGMATGNDDFSYSYFVKLDGTTFLYDAQRVPFFYGNTSSDNNTHNDLNYGGNTIDVSRYGGVICGTPSAFTVDTWHNVIVTKSGSTFVLYVDGIEKCTETFGGSNIIANKLIINDWGDPGSGYSVDGVWYDEIAFWNRTLTSQEALEIYDSQFSGGNIITGNGYDFDLDNITVTGAIVSAGATINIANSTVSTVDVSGADAAGDGQDGGTINLTGNTIAGALIANGGDSTDYGYGGAAGTINLDGTSSATSQTANAGADGPNLRAGQGTSGGSTGSSSVIGCTDPSASNYRANATVDNGSCRYPVVVVRGCMDPSATNYNSNATVNGSCSYSTYNPYTPPGSGGNDGGGNGDLGGLGGNLGGTATVGSLVFNPLNPFGLNPNNQLGFTYFGNPLEGLQPIGNLDLSLITFNADFPISSFLFAPLPQSITDALNRSAKLASAVTSVGITRAQDLVSLTRQPIKLPASDDTPGLFMVSNGTTTLDNYIANDLKKGLVQLVYVKTGDVLNVSLIPLSTGKVTGKFDGKDISFIQSPGKMVSSIITASTTPGKYFLTTQSAPLPLMIEVLSPPPSNPVKPPGFWTRVVNWFSRLFH